MGEPDGRGPHEWTLALHADMLEDGILHGTAN